MAKYTKAQAESAKRYLAKFAEIRIRTTPDEKKIIEKRAADAGKSVNQYVKDCALSRHDCEQ